MKKIFKLIVGCFICAAVFSGCWNEHDRNIKIAVRDSDDTYQFYARYSKSQTGRVQHYINDCIKPNGLFASTNDYFNVDTKLNDDTHFHIKSSPGEVEIKLNKGENSVESYMRIKKMCEGIKNILAGKKATV